MGAPDYPFTTDPQFGNDPARLNQLKFDAQRAWAEYVPARVRINENAIHPQDYLQIYRQFAFGSLVDLFMTDERTYRSAPPCGTGDLHSYMVSYLKVDYNKWWNFGRSNMVGVEFMTPSVTSANFKDIIENAVLHTSAEEQALQEVGTDSLIEDLVRLTNPHVKFFNSEYWGYATVEFNRSYCEYTAYDIDKSQNSADVAKRELRRLRVPVNRVLIKDA